MLTRYEFNRKKCSSACIYTLWYTVCDSIHRIVPVMRRIQTFSCVYIFETCDLFINHYHYAHSSIPGNYTLALNTLALTPVSRNLGLFCTYSAINRVQRKLLVSLCFSMLLVIRNCVLYILWEIWSLNL